MMTENKFVVRRMGQVHISVPAMARYKMLKGETTMNIEKIRDFQGREIGRIQDFGTVKKLFSPQGQLLGTYDKVFNKTKDVRGNVIAVGEALTRLL